MTNSFADPFHIRSDESMRRRKRQPEERPELPPPHRIFPSPDRQNPFGDPRKPPVFRPSDLPPPATPYPPPPIPGGTPIVSPIYPLPPGLVPEIPVPPARPPHEVDPPTENPYSNLDFNPNFPATQSVLSRANPVTRNTAGDDLVRKVLAILSGNANSATGDPAAAFRAKEPVTPFSDQQSGSSVSGEELSADPGAPVRMLSSLLLGGRRPGPDVAQRQRDSEPSRGLVSGKPMEMRPVQPPIFFPFY